MVISLLRAPDRALCFAPLWRQNCSCQAPLPRWLGLRPEGQPVRQGVGQAGFADAALRLLDGVFDAIPADDPLVAVVGHVGSTGIAVAGLADGAGIDEITAPGIELDAAARAAQRLHSQQATFQPEQRRDVSVAEEGHRRLKTGEDLPGVNVREDVGALVERRAVADGEPL